MSMIEKVNLLHRKWITICCMGLASGLPLALTGSTLQAWYTASGVNLVTIGALSLIGLPYVLKFLWAPLLDYVEFGNFGRRRVWVLFMMVLLIMSVLMLASIRPERDPLWMACIAGLVAFFSATLDIAVDAYRVDVLTEKERGLGSAYYVFAYRVGAMISGGLALLLADRIGWVNTYHFMAALLCVLTVPIYFAYPVKELPVKETAIWKTAKAAFVNLWQREEIGWVLLFILLYKLGDALALALMSNFLLKELQFTLSEIGVAYKVVGFFAAIFGGFCGGVLLSRWSLYKGLLVFGILQAVSNLCFALLAYAGHVTWLMGLSVFVEFYCNGMSTAALMAFLMSICNSQYSATQFAVLTALATLGRVFVGVPAAWLVAWLGWMPFYIVCTAVCLPGLLILIMMKRELCGFNYETVPVSTT